MSVDFADWTEWREFKDVDLNQSFVLSWELTNGSLRVDVDLFICPNHPFYEPPRPSERACYRPAHIEFTSCTSVSESGVQASDSLADVVGALVGGQIKGLRRVIDGRYQMSGRFGTVDIVAERPMIRLQDPTF